MREDWGKIGKAKDKLLLKNIILLKVVDLHRFLPISVLVVIKSSFLKGSLCPVTWIFMAFSWPDRLLKISEDGVSFVFYVSGFYFFTDIGALTLCFLTENDFLVGDSTDVCLVVLPIFAFLLI